MPETAQAGDSVRDIVAKILNNQSVGGGGGASAAADVTVAATPSNYTAATQDVEDHLVGVDNELGNVSTTADGAAADAATAIIDAAAALVRTNHTGLQASTSVTQSQTTWTDTPTITVAADVNGKLIKGSAATVKQATLILGIGTDTAFPFVNIGTAAWQFIGDATSVLKDGNNTTIWTGGAGVGATVWPGGSAFIVSEGSNTWRIYQSSAAVHVGADSLADDSYEAAVPVLTGRVAGETLTQWQPVYLKTDGKWWLTDGDASAVAADGVGLAVAGASAEAAVSVLRRGVVRNDGWAWGTVGGPIYLDVTAGVMTQTLPNSTGLGSKPVGFALSDDEMYVDFPVAVPSLPVRTMSISFDPKVVCDGTIDRLFLMHVLAAGFPNGLKVLSWAVSFDADPATEADLDLKRADAFIGVANAAVMDVLDTTAGVSSEATAANINGGAAVAVGKVLYLEFGTAYTVASLQVIFTMTYQAQ